MLDRLNQIYPVRYTAFFVALGLTSLSLLVFVASGQGGWMLLIFGALTAVGIYDLQQTHHAVLRNYPIIGHLRFMLEAIRPELRQYFLESETEAAPFSRAQRTLVYARAKGQSDKRPFGTQLDVSAAGYEWITHSLAPTHLHDHNFRVAIGGASCTQPYDISLFNVSAMSFGALSANAIMALNKGAYMGGFAHDTGEGSISRHHRVHGGDLIWEIGSGYFGCRDSEGRFSAERFVENALSPQVKMIEIKLSQGAKPGHGGVLLGPKVTAEIAEARGVQIGEDCVSPSSHSSFSTPLELLQFVQQLRTLSEGKPVGFKLCIGHPWEWFGMPKPCRKVRSCPTSSWWMALRVGQGRHRWSFPTTLAHPCKKACAWFTTPWWALICATRYGWVPAARSSAALTSRAPWRWARIGATVHVASCSHWAVFRHKRATVATAPRA